MGIMLMIAFMGGFLFGATSMLLFLVCYAIGRGNREEKKSEQNSTREKSGKEAGKEGVE